MNIGKYIISLFLTFWKNDKTKDVVEFTLRHRQMNNLPESLSICKDDNRERFRSGETVTRINRIAVPLVFSTGPDGETFLTVERHHEVLLFLTEFSPPIEADDVRRPKVRCC